MANPAGESNAEALRLDFDRRLAEAGAYINAIRSSLDILATTVAKRHSIPRERLDRICFPFAKSEAEFKSGSHKGKEFVRCIPSSERTIIESLKPYKGGNDLLWSLHHLDITRKHHRLLSVEPYSAKFLIMGWGLSKHFTPLRTGGMSMPHETEVGSIAKGAPQYKMEFSAYIGLNEVGPLARNPIIPALDKLAGFANSIIKLFDTP